MKRISTQLVVSFLIVALLPTLPLSLVVRDLLERRFGPTLADPLKLALDSGMVESRAHLKELRQKLQFRVTELGLELLDQRGVLLDSSGNVLPADSLATFLSERDGLWEKAASLPAMETRGDNSVKRLGDTLAIRVGGARGTSSVFLQPLPDGMVERAGDMTAGISLLEMVRNGDGRVISSFVRPFLLVYGILIFVALLVGIVWSRQMVKPLEILVNATRRVAEGDFDFRIQRQGPGEVGELVQSFDQMIGKLTDQRRDLARLERAAAWRGMARTLAHEVKNPLTPILLAVNQARDSYGGNDEKHRILLTEVAEIVGEEVESLRRLVREFGDFARLPKPDLKQGNPRAMLHELAQLYGSDCLRLIANTAPENGWFDHAALRRALINLIDNGLAACQEAGQPEIVNLKATGSAGGIQLEVRDEGSGIAPENLERIFEPDFTTKSGGMGLGLAIVENIIIGHGGSIDVESTLKEGTRFSIKLPLLLVRAAKPVPGDELQ